MKKILVIITVLALTLCLIHNLTYKGQIINYGPGGSVEMRNCWKYYFDSAWDNKIPLNEYNFPDIESILYVSPLLIRENFPTDYPFILQYALIRVQNRYTISFCGLDYTENEVKPYIGTDPPSFSYFFETTKDVSMTDELMKQIALTIYWKNKHDKEKTLIELRTLKYVNIEKIKLLDVKPYVFIENNN